MRLVVALVVVWSAAAHAQAVVSAVLDAQGLPDTSVKKIQRATEGVLKQLSGLSVGEGPAWKKGAPRRCGDDCARDVVRGIPVPGVVLLDLKADAKDRLTFELSFWLEGEKLGARRGDGTLDSLEAALKPPLDALLPGWARKGFGGLRLQVEPGSTVKIDGRVAQAAAGEVVALPAGVHQVDVVLPDGNAVLQRLDVPEGSRGRLQVAASTEFASTRAASSGTGVLRTTSYAVFMAGAAAIAGGLIAGALSRGTGADLTPCRADTRDCATLDTVLERNRQAQAYATTGNVLIGAGAGLVAVGAGLFAIDAVAP